MIRIIVMVMIIDMIIIITIIINTDITIIYIPRYAKQPHMILIPIEAAMARPTLLCNDDVTSMRGLLGVGVSRPL
jgi:hypothetical protein